MLQSEREKLENKAGEYLSIGITEGGIPRGSIGVPWVATTQAYNMRLPDVYLAPEDLQDEALMARIGQHRVIGCYIWAPLEDYSFLSRWKDLEDLNIKNGDAIRDLDFLAELTECRMLFLQNAKLKDLGMILEVKKRSKAMFGCLRCIGLDNCVVEDLSDFERENLRFSEFLVWNPQSRNERDRWSVVSAHTRRYYEFRE